MAKTYCCMCARQIVSWNCPFNDVTVYSQRVTLMGCGKVACQECASEIDENGLFPEERGSAERLNQYMKQ